MSKKRQSEEEEKNNEPDFKTVFLGQRSNHFQTEGSTATTGTQLLVSGTHLSQDKLAVHNNGFLCFPF